MSKKYKDLPVSEKTHTKIMTLKLEVLGDKKRKSVEDVINYLLNILEDYRKIKRIGFTDEEKLKMLKEQGKRIVEEVEQLENKKQLENE